MNKQRITTKQLALCSVLLTLMQHCPMTQIAPPTQNARISPCPIFDLGDRLSTSRA